MLIIERGYIEVRDVNIVSNVVLHFKVCSLLHNQRFIDTDRRHYYFICIMNLTFQLFYIFVRLGKQSERNLNERIGSNNHVIHICYNENSRSDRIRKQKTISGLRSDCIWEDDRLAAEVNVISYFIVKLRRHNERVNTSNGQAFYLII